MAWCLNVHMLKGCIIVYYSIIVWCRWIGWWLPRGGRGWVRSQLQENYICLHQPPHPHTHQQHATPPTFQNDQHLLSWPFNHVKNIFLHQSENLNNRTILCQSFSSLQISWSWLVLNYCGNLLAATFNQHCWPLDQPTGQQSNFLLRRHFPLDDWPEPPSSCRLFVHISY